MDLDPPAPPARGYYYPHAEEEGEEGEVAYEDDNVYDDEAEEEEEEEEEDEAPPPEAVNELMAHVGSATPAAAAVATPQGGDEGGEDEDKDAPIRWSRLPSVLLRLFRDWREPRVLARLLYGVHALVDADAPARSYVCELRRAALPACLATLLPPTERVSWLRVLGVAHAAGTTVSLSAHAEVAAYVLWARALIFLALWYSERGARCFFFARNVRLGATLGAAPPSPALLRAFLPQLAQHVSGFVARGGQDADTLVTGCLQTLVAGIPAPAVPVPVPAPTTTPGTAA